MQLLTTFITRQLHSLNQLVRWRTWWIASNLKPRVAFCRKILWCSSDPQTYEQNNCPQTFFYVADYEFYHGLLNNCLLIGQKVNKHRLSWKHNALTQKRFVNKWFQYQSLRIWRKPYYLMKISNLYKLSSLLLLLMTFFHDGGLCLLYFWEVA